MKAFLYTLVLTAVLIAAVAYLHSLPRRTAIRPHEPRTPMTVMSEPAELPEISPSDIAQTNQDAFFEIGMELLDLWHLPEAIGVFETLVERDSTHMWAYLRLVECYSHPIISLERKAKQRLEKAFDVARLTGADTLWASALKNLFVAGLPGLAVQNLKELEKNTGVSDDLLLFLGTAHLENGEPDEAERDLGDLLDRDPSLGRARELLVRCKVVKGEYEDAELLSRDLATLYPEEPYPYVLLSQVLLLRDEVEEAVEFGNNALQIDPRYIPAIVSRAHVHVAQGELEAARTNFEKLLLFDKPMLSAFGADGIAFVGFLSGRFDAAGRDMDEAVRLAMNAGSTRRGLVYAFRLIDYLCELGRSDAAAAVLDRWVIRSGDIPTRLGQMRILISVKDMASVRHGLDRIGETTEWLQWMRILGIDFTDVYALSLIKEENFTGALEIMAEADKDNRGGGRRAYLKGYASFENGDAERAADYFKEARTRLRSIEFPYHSDPVLNVQSVFFLAETALARGESEEAARFYTDFLDMWGEADWELQAVERARRKLETLSSTPPGG